MKIPLSWLQDYLSIDLPLLDLAKMLTMAGLEVEEIKLVGLPNPYHQNPEVRREFKLTGISWEEDKIVVAQIDEVMPHPNADRLVLCRIYDGNGEITVLTGAPNLFEYKGIGPLGKPLKVAYAREGARIYDGHQPGNVLTTLKRAKIRGVDSFSMVCSEKELGISEEHEGVIILDEDAPTGVPLVEYMGDAVLEISILPNMVRNASLLGVARELSALTGLPVRKPQATLPHDGPSIEGKAAIDIQAPGLNPRFVVGLVEGLKPQPSPYWVQRRLKLAGMRPINSVVDATNYVMLELGQPLHAFDYDTLFERAGHHAPTIITRAAHQGEKLTTLDNVERTLEPYTVMVCDTAGPLSLAGVMGGLESEVHPHTTRVLLEGASWNFINVRRTASVQHLNSEAAYRFSRGVHPALASQGVILGLQRMAEWSGGQVYKGLVDQYPAPPDDPEVELTTTDLQRILGIERSVEEITAILTRLEFTCRVSGGSVFAKTPPHRLDIGQGATGKADLLEEVARILGYDNIPVSYLPEELPEVRRNRPVEIENQTRQTLVRLGLQEVVNYRLTSREREMRLYPPGFEIPNQDYLGIKNPLSPERSILRRSVLASVLETLEKNVRLADRLALFEIGPVFLPNPGQPLPDEPLRLSLAMAGSRLPPAWDAKENVSLDFYDLKGIVEALLQELNVSEVSFDPFEHPAFHPGKCAQVRAGETQLGVMGELHPLVKENYNFLPPPVLAGDFDLDALIARAANRQEVAPVPTYPPVLEDLAVIVDEGTPAEQVETAIRQGGGQRLKAVRLFDIYRGEQVGDEKKSLAYSLTYQAEDHTLSADEAAQIRQKILRRLEAALGAKIRS